MCIYCSGTNKFLYHFHLSSASIRSSYNHHFDYSTTIMRFHATTFTYQNGGHGIINKPRNHSA